MSLQIKTILVSINIKSKGTWSAPFRRPHGPLHDAPSAYSYFSGHKLLVNFRNYPILELLKRWWVVFIYNLKYEILLKAGSYSFFFSFFFFLNLKEHFINIFSLLKWLISKGISLTWISKTQYDWNDSSKLWLGNFYCWFCDGRGEPARVLSFIQHIKNNAM